MQISIEKSMLARSLYRAFAIAATVACVAVSGWAGETVLYSFPGGANGSNPQGVLAMDSSGNLYGTTPTGGLNGGCTDSTCGVVYELSPSVGGGWTETVLYSFKGTTDGGDPQAGGHTGFRRESVRHNPGGRRYQLQPNWVRNSLRTGARFGWKLDGKNSV